MRYQYIDEVGTLEDAVRGLAGVELIGVDTEAAGYHRYNDRISLVQVSTRQANLIIDPIALRDLGELGPILLDEGVEKVFHDADFDLRILHRDLGLTVRNLFDTQIAAAFLGERQLGLGSIVETFLGVTLPKAYQRADWAVRPLSPEMLEYAATDTAYLPKLRDRLLEDLRRLDRERWAREEFVRRENTRWEQPDEAGAFLRIKGARDLTPRGLAILREICQWRERVGEERDQATFRIMPNQAMIEIALKGPRNRQALRDIKGISSGLLDRRGRELIEAVERGLAVPESDLPRFPAARRWERDVEAEARAERLRAARNRRADELNLDPGFLMSRALLEEIARRNPASAEQLADVDDVRNWQIEAVGEDLLRCLRT